MKKRILAIVLSVMACLSLLAAPISAVAVGNSNYQATVVDTVKTSDVVKSIKVDAKSKEPVALAEIKSATGKEVAQINIIPAKAPQIAKMTQTELASAIAVITKAVSTVSNAPSEAAAPVISALKAADKTATIAPISFGGNSTFAFPVEVSVNVGKSVSAGKYNVYYVRTGGRIAESGTATVNSKGVATFSIKRSADYFLSDKAINTKAAVK